MAPVGNGGCPHLGRGGEPDAPSPSSAGPPPTALARAVTCRGSAGRPVAHVARDLGIHKEVLRNWVCRAEAEAGERDDRLTSAEQEELKQLRRENAELRWANEILKAASAFLRPNSTVPGRGRPGDRAPQGHGPRGRVRLPGAGAVRVRLLCALEAVEVGPPAA
ncbi:transposase [Streptomyces sp. NPDC000851]